MKYNHESIQHSHTLSHPRITYSDLVVPVAQANINTRRFLAPQNAGQDIGSTWSIGLGCYT